MGERLEASETARRRFLADVTHELRTPLAVLQAGIEAQLDGIHPRDDVHLATLRDQTRTLDRLVEDLRTLALGDAGRLTLYPEVVARSGRRHRRRGGDLRRRYRPSRHGGCRRRRRRARRRSCPADPGAHELADQRRAPHAARWRRHRDDAGTGRPSSSSPSPTPDLGIAGDPELLFERFTRSADSGGSGLGLTIARQLVELHGGTLVAANIEGGGARVTATLPRQRRDYSVGRPSRASEALLHSG